MIPKRSDFPNDFLLGASTSAYQIEGHARGGAGVTHWDTFAATPGNVIGAENGALACDHIGHLETDLDLLAQGQFDVYRFSTSWARVLPEGRGTINSEGLDFYDRLVDGLVARGIKPALTLYHWELPAALADLGGWRNRDIAGWMSDYGQIVLDRIGDRLWSVAPINEPWCVSWLSHFLGHHAPGLRDIRATARAMHHVALTHGMVTQMMRAHGQTNLGAVVNLEYAAPADDSAATRAAALRYDAIYNRFFLSAFLNGHYPQAVIEGLEPHMPNQWERDLETIAQPLDWLGLNYYTRSLVEAAPGPWPSLVTRPGPLAKTAIGWEIYPKGLGHFLTRIRDAYSRKLPLYVTENGLAHHDPIRDGTVNDQGRIAFLAAHLDQIRAAVANGVPVKGYFTWSLMDNYEWALGYGPKFGLIHVDRSTLARRPKASYHALAQAWTKG